jgi:hypothetical protein
MFSKKETHFYLSFLYQWYSASVRARVLDACDILPGEPGRP